MELISRNNTPDTEKSISSLPGGIFATRNAFIGLLENQIYPDYDLRSSSDSFTRAFHGGTINFDLPFDIPLTESLYSPFLAQEQLLNTFSDAIAASGPSVLPRSMQNHGRWLSQLPSLFGSSLLDTAVRAVSLVHLGRVQQTEVLVQESRKFYGNALRLLKHSITDNTQGMATETLSATILLSFYEMFASDSNQSWVRHAGGAGTLMRIRGPARHLTGIDRDVYLAYRHTIVIDAFQKDDACFLSEPVWLELARQVHDDLRTEDMSKERMMMFDLGEEFYMENVFIPATCRDTKTYLDSRKDLTPEQCAFYEESIRDRCHSHRGKLKSINLRFRATIRKLGLGHSTYKAPDPVFPIQYGFVNVFIASTNVGYWTIMIILNSILEEMEKGAAPNTTGLYVMENQEIAREICRATPFMMTSSFLGPFFIIFALRLSLMVFDQGPERDWVVRKLVQIGNTHMKMAADIPDLSPDKKRSDPERVVATLPTADPYEDINWDVDGADFLDPAFDV